MLENILKETNLLKVGENLISMQIPRKLAKTLIQPHKQKQLNFIDVFQEKCESFYIASICCCRQRPVLKIQTEK